MPKQESGNVDPRQIKGDWRQGNSNVVPMYENQSPMIGPYTSPMYTSGFPSPLVGPFASPLIGDFIVGGRTGGIAPLGAAPFTDGQLLIGNGQTGGVTKATLTEGTNITITNSPGGITIASTGGSSSGSGGGTFTAPPTTGWSQVNAGSSVLATSASTVSLTNIFGLNVNYRLAVRTAPATPYTITLFIRFLTTLVGGVGWRDSATGRLVAIQPSQSGMTVNYMTNATTFSSQPVNQTFAGSLGGDGYWIILADTGANHTADVSSNYNEQVRIYNASRTAWCANPNEVFFFGGPNNNNFPGYAVIYSWA